MVRNSHLLSSLAVASLTASVASAGTFQTITIDGTFADWTGVPVLNSDPSGDGNPIDLADVQVANDADNLYLRLTWHAEVNPTTAGGVYLGFDTDRDLATGFNVFGLNLVGSEAAFQNDFPFEQATGGFNVGSLSANATIAPIVFGDPSAVTTSWEYSIPRNLAYSDDSAPVFVGAGFNLLAYTSPSGAGSAADVSGVVSYDFASPVVGASWANAGSGAWGTAANWNPAVVPNDAATPVTFGGAITAPSTVTVDGDYAAASITFDNAANRYTLAPSAATSSLVVAGAITVASGSHTLAVDTKAASLDVAATAGSLDVAGGRLAIDYVTGQPSAYASLAAAVLAGDLVSTVGGNARAVALVEASDLNVTTFGDLAVDADAVLVRGTLAGDTNIDLAVGFNDLLSLAQNYNGTGKQWFDGDFNYDGSVNFTDLLALAQNYNGTLLSAADLTEIGGASFAADFALARSLVPEPATLSLIAGAAFCVARRRR